MPTRLAAMASTPPCAGGVYSLVRSLERLACSVVVRVGVGLAIALKPREPKAGAAAGDTVAGAVTAGAAALVLTMVVALSPAFGGVSTAARVCVSASVSAWAGGANAATSPPDAASTAEVLTAGSADRETAVDSSESGLYLPGARWRPVQLSGTLNLSSACEVSCRVRVRGCTRPARTRPDLAGRLCVGFTPRSGLDRPDVVPPLLPSGCRAPNPVCGGR